MPKVIPYQTTHIRPSLTDEIAKLRPYRVYGTQVQGEDCAPAMAIFPKGVDMSAWPKIPPRDVQNIFDKYGLSQLSSMSELLSGVLSDMLNTEHGQSVADYDFEVEYAELYDSVRTILAIAPIFAQAQAETIQSGKASADFHRMGQGAAITALITAAITFEETHFPPTQKPKGIAYWHDDAYYLALILQSSSAKEIAVTHADAPYVKFIEAALNLAQVNHSGRRAISDELKRRKRDPWWRAVRGQRISATPHT